MNESYRQILRPIVMPDHAIENHCAETKTITVRDFVAVAPDDIHWEQVQIAEFVARKLGGSHYEITLGRYSAYSRLNGWAVVDVQ